MKDEVFYDTNILIYAYDLAEPEKREVCKTLVSNVFTGKVKGVISNQVLVELHNALTRKLGVGANEARVIVESLISSPNWLKVTFSHNTVKSALETAKAFNSPFLDTLIAETMKENNLNRIITENEGDFRKISGLRVLNPMTH